MNARPMMVTQQTVRNLALGDKFFLRVAAVSSAGASPPAVLEQPIHIQEVIGKVFPLISCSPVLPRHLLRWVGKLRPLGRANGTVISPHPTLSCTSHMLSPACLKKVPGSSAASLWRSRRFPSIGEGAP